MTIMNPETSRAAGKKGGVSLSVSQMFLTPNDYMIIICVASIRFTNSW